MTSARRVCVVVGVGPGNGAACVRRFAKDGYEVAMLARGDLSALENEVPGTKAFVCDVANEASITDALAHVRAAAVAIDAEHHGDTVTLVAHVYAEDGRRSVVASRRLDPHIDAAAAAADVVAELLEGGAADLADLAGSSR